MVYFLPALVILRLFVYLLQSLGLGIKTEAAEPRPVLLGVGVIGEWLSDLYFTLLRKRFYSTYHIRSYHLRSAY